MLEVKTERLTLRTPSLDDAPRMQRILANFEVAKYLSRVPHPYPENAATSYLQGLLAEPARYNVNFSILDRDGQFCGMTGFRREGGMPQLGYYLDPLHWGKGYMSEACKAVVEWMFDNYAPAHIKSGIFLFNPASIALQNKLGFTEVGRSTIHCLAQSADFEHIDTQLTKDAFIQATQ